MPRSHTPSGASFPEEKGSTNVSSMDHAEAPWAEALPTENAVATQGSWYALLAWVGGFLLMFGMMLFDLITGWFSK